MLLKIGFLLLLIAAVCNASEYEEGKHMHPRNLYSIKNVPKEELEANFWRKQAQEQLKAHLERKENKNVAKNIIMFLGDGMSIPTLAAARVVLGNENKQLSFEKFPYTGLSKTYCVDAQTADSACSATAYLCGVKANDGTIGVTANVTRMNCDAMLEEKNQVTSIAQWAQNAGKSTGIVTTTRITHASPSGTYAHVANREWESDSDVSRDKADPKKCTDIAQQLINQEPGKNFKVILGGGRKNFLPNDTQDEEGSNGVREDKKNLIDEWKKNKGDKGKYVWNKKDLTAIDPKKTEYLLGLFESDHCKYHLDVIAEKAEDEEPSLADMVTKAIDVLSQEKNGFFLFVEGGRIDHAHHETRPRKALDETIEFSKAVEVALKKTKVDDTLIIVTSDHAHTLSISGYPSRGNDIFGIAVAKAEDGLPMATLNYANGPGYAIHVNKDGGRKDYTKVVDTKDKDFQSPSLAPLYIETHGADDVAVFASGPWSHLFTGNYEQNTIPHLMAFAANISTEGNKKNSGGTGSISSPIIGLILGSTLAVFYNIFN